MKAIVTVDGDRVDLKVGAMECQDLVGTIERLTSEKKDLQREVALYRMSRCQELIAEKKERVTPPPDTPSSSRDLGVYGKRLELRVRDHACQDCGEEWLSVVVDGYEVLSLCLGMLEIIAGRSRGKDLLSGQ